MLKLVNSGPTQHNPKLDFEEKKKGGEESLYSRYQVESTELRKLQSNID